MMTSTPVTQQQQTDGRTVREVVAFNHELVNEVWCRRVFRQLLQSLELQYAMQMPPRPINPDTVVVLDSGDPMLLPSPETGAAWSEAGDMYDLAAVVHYAITREFPPAAPLLGRVALTPGDYSDSFIGAVDRCLSPDPEQRPRNIDQLRDLLGIVQLGTPIAPQAMHQVLPQPAPHSVAAPGKPEPDASFLKDPAPAGARGQPKRWLLLVAAATVLLAALGALFGLLHQTDSRDAVVLALPDEAPAPQAQAAPAAPPQPGASPAAEPPDAIAILAAADGATPMPQASGQQAPSAGPSATVTAIPPEPANVANGPAAGNRQAAAGPGATYKLDIKPWGMIQVDGVDRGASPPLKRLSLPPGPHTIRIVNPNYPEHTVSVNAAKGDASVIELDFTVEDPQ